MTKDSVHVTSRALARQMCTAHRGSPQVESTASMFEKNRTCPTAMSRTTQCRGKVPTGTIDGEAEVLPGQKTAKAVVDGSCKAACATDICKTLSTAIRLQTLLRNKKGYKHSLLQSLSPA
eukprot:5863399-Amphidinium_carterae.1